MSERRLGRRELLVRGGIAAGAAALGAAGGYAVGHDASEDEISDGGGFDLDPAYVNLTTFLIATHPRPVREAIARHRERLDTSAAVYLRDAEPAFEEDARRAAGAYLGAPSDEIALTDSTTMGAALVYGGLRLRAGDEVVTTEHDFYATHEALRLRAERDGIRVRRIRLYDDPAGASVEEIVAAVARGLSRRTRCLAVTWVHSSTGLKLPLAEIAAVVADANRARPPDERVLLAVDGVHGFGVEAESPVALGADVFFSGCHKWLFGPRGTGILWAAPHAWERLSPTIPTFYGPAYGAWLQGRAPDGVPPGPLMTPGGFNCFEHKWALTEAFAFHDGLGQAEVTRRTHTLATRMKVGLGAIDGVEVVTPRDETLSAGLVCANVAGRDPGELADRLRAEHDVIASVTPYATRYLRFGPSIANREEDVDRAVEAVAALV